jgi:hypothetical protein
LNKREIAALYAFNKVPRNGLVAEYLLHEGHGAVAHDSAGHHDGTIFGATWAYLGQTLSSARGSGLARESSTENV